MAHQFPNLFRPIRIGKYSLQSRIVCTGHATCFESEGLFTERHLHYYKEKAAGGAGMIITEAAGVGAELTGQNGIIGLCKNNATGDTVSTGPLLGGTTVDCTAEGLPSSPGDPIIVLTIGVAD